MTDAEPAGAPVAAPFDASVDARVRTVLVVSKTHLDVGFTATAAQVRARYLDDYFPRAMSVADRLRERGGPERLRWTTGSWILTEALDAADPTRRADLEQAIEHGDLCWHALPFTLHIEYCDRSLLEHGLSLSAALDRRFGRHTRAAKVTDVPGHTRGLVSVLAAAGVDLLHVGVNPASSCPQVPDRFRWVDPAAVGGDEPSIQVMYQPGGYGDVQIVDLPGPDGPVAVVVDLTGDNLGPRRADDVIAQWASLARRFPSAQIAAATLDDVAAVMAATAGSLPVIDAEIGDTWIQGVGSDPAKTAGFRALCRLRRRWIDDDVVAVDDTALRAASTALLCVAEHTWGLDQKTHWPDTTHWSADALASLLGDPAHGASSGDPAATPRPAAISGDPSTHSVDGSPEMGPAATRAFAQSWEEQRRYLDEFVDRLAHGGRTDLAVEARRALDATRTFVARVAQVGESGGSSGATPGGVAEPSRNESDRVSARLGELALSFDVDGAVVGLRDGDGHELASPAAPLARLAFQTFDAADFEHWYSTYNAGTVDEDQWWARWDNTKPGLERSGAVSRWWTPQLTDVVELDDRTVAVLAFDVDADAPVALPVRAELSVRRVDGDDAAVEFELQWFDRPVARWPGAVWWTFAPLVEDPECWRMSKLDEWVSPFEVVSGGGAHLHCADRVRELSAGVELELVDTSLVAPGRPRLLEWPVAPVDLSGGWHVCLHDNVWGTNFPMWDGGSQRFRVLLRWGRAVAWRTS